MLFKPTGKYLESYEAGARAYYSGKKLEDNPHLSGPDVSMSTWWETGYVQAEEVNEDNN